MFVFHTQSLFKARGIRKPLHWLLQNGFPVSAARAIARETYQSLPLVHLERLCRLLHCTPNDVVRWQPPEGTVVTGHPLQALIDSPLAGLEWMSRLEALSLDELRALGRKLEGNQPDEPA